MTVDLVLFASLLVAVYVTTSFIHLFAKACMAQYQLRHIPTVGPSGILTSFYGAYKIFFNAHDTIQQGYEKYRGRAFRVPLILKWMIVVSGSKMVEDLRKGTEDQMSFADALADILASQYTIGPHAHIDPWHFEVVRGALTRNLPKYSPAIRDEIAASYSDLIPQKSEWVEVSARHTIAQIVVRTSNRVFVGLPLCRNPEWIKLNENFAVDLMTGAGTVLLFPNVLKPAVARILTKVPSHIKRATELLRPTIEDRMAKLDQYGSDWPDKPNDMVTWLIEKAKVLGKEQSVRDLTLRIITINFAALHSTTSTLTRALFDLASFPHHIQALREEVDSVTGGGDITPASLDKMYKLDSFIKESQRFGSSLSALSMQRKLRKDFTFSDGTTIPAGYTVAVAAVATHHDSALYPEADQFDGFRFSRRREAESSGTGTPTSKHQLISLSADYLLFGNGHFTCPGRFFAVHQVKAMFAYVLQNYDVKLEREGVRPKDIWLETLAIPDPDAKLMFRKRQ